MDAIVCPLCGQPLGRNAGAGEVITCRRCGNAYAVPGAAAAPGDVLDGSPMAAGHGGTASTPASRPRASGYAIASLVCGILLLAPLALVFGIIALVKTKDARVGGKHMAVGGLILGLLGSYLLVNVSVAVFNNAQERANKVKCAANMYAIYNAIVQYATHDPQHRLPDHPGQLLLDETFYPEVLICPNSKDTPAIGDTAQERTAKFSAGGHDSYVYLGAGKRIGTATNVILIYEVMGRHHNYDGFNACFGDGHVEYIFGATAARVQAELRAGQNPPPSSPYGPSP